MAKWFFRARDGLCTVDIEFDTDDPFEVCMTKHRRNNGRLLCYVHKRETNSYLMLVEKGWSPYFVKYGRSRVYQGEMTNAEVRAMAAGKGIGDPSANVGGPSRDHEVLLPSWHYRTLGVEVYRANGIAAGVLSVRLDYEAIVQAVDDEDEITVFCALQSGIAIWSGDGAVVFAGSPHHKFNLWIPDRDNEIGREFVDLIQTRYGGHDRSFVYVGGKAMRYQGGKSEIILESIDQLSDSPA